MLKIKDNVDLKELEKFGFTLKPHGIYYAPGRSWNSCIFIIRNNIDLLRDDAVSDDGIDDLMFNLIQAGLVETGEEMEETI